MSAQPLFFENFSSLRIAYRKKSANVEKKRIDYYPFGMPMPNRQIVGGQPYRYGYQGEFAETDPETGKPAFQLRLYDPRLGRWLTTDPMGQYHSPYMAMDNRPNMSVDPTGGCTVGVDCPSEFNHMGTGTVVLDEIVVGGGSISGGIPYETSGLDFAFMENIFNNIPKGTMRPSDYDFTNKWAESSNLAANVTYDIANSFSVTAQTLNPFDKQLQNIDGTGVTRGSNGHLGNAVTVITTLAPVPVKGVSIAGVTTATQISKNAVIYGLKVTNHAWRKAGLGRGATVEMVEATIKYGKVTLEKGVGRFAENEIKVYIHNNVKVVVDNTRKLIVSINNIAGFKF